MEKEPKQKKPSQKEFESRVLELLKKGLTTEKIGEALRKEGIHPKEYSQKISKILKEKYENPDFKNLERKLNAIKNHLEKNKGDKRAMREKDRIFSRLRRIRLYLKK
jgi:ribosomal protein S15P/S13E